MNAPLPAAHKLIAGLLLAASGVHQCPRFWRSRRPRNYPGVPIRRSVTDDYIVCLEDGKKLKMLKRHLMTAYQMTPEAVPGEVEP